MNNFLMILQLTLDGYLPTFFIVPLFPSSNVFPFSVQLHLHLQLISGTFQKNCFRLLRNSCFPFSLLYKFVLFSFYKMQSQKLFGRTCVQMLIKSIFIILNYDLQLIYVGSWLQQNQYQPRHFSKVSTDQLLFKYLFFWLNYNSQT